MKNDLFKMGFLREQFDDNGSDAGGDFEYDDSVSDLYEPDGDASEGQPQVVQPPGQSSSAIDYDRLGQTIARSVQPPQQVQQPATMTDEEFRKHTKYFAVTPEHVNQLFNAELPVEQKMQLLQQMLDGSVTHALQVANLSTSHRLEQVNQRFEPLLTERQQAAKDKFLGTLERISPSIKGQRPMLEFAIQKLRENGYQPQGEAADRKAIVSMFTALMKQSNPNFVLQRPSGGNGAGRVQSSSTVNGAGGSGQGRGGPKAKSAAMAVFDRK